MAKTFSKRQNEILSNMNLVLHNVFVLYFILLLSLANMFYLVTAKNYMFAAIFILTGFITSFFSKNMMVILCIALTVTNVLQFGKRAALEEGLTTKVEEEEEEEEEGFKNEIKGGEEDTATSPNLKKSAKTSKSVANMEEDNEVKLAGMEKQYKKLAELQDKITKNMKSVVEPMQEAKFIVNDLAQTLGLQDVAGVQRSNK